MKHNWEYKRLGDICNIYQPQTISTKKLVKDGEYDVFGANGIIGKYDRYNHAESEILMTCRGATCGTINVSTPNSWINGNAMVIHRKDDLLTFNFLKECLKTLDYSTIITGAAQPQITQQSLSPVCIPVPPIEVQEHIVAELDAINALIEKNRDVIRNLDALTKSLFYDTFGDPISNPKGWEVKPMSHIYKFQYGKGNNIPENKGNYPVYGSNGIVGFHTQYNSEDAPVIGHIGAYAGNVVWGKGKHFVTYNGVICRLINPNVNAIYGYYLLKYQNYMETARVGAAQPFVSYSGLEKPIVPVPPIALQESFAECIEAIEGEKAKVEAEIAELQTLLDSRMDYWFN